MRFIAFAALMAAACSSGTGIGSAGGGAGGGAGGSGGYDAGTDSCPLGTTRLEVKAPMFDIPQASDFYQCFAQTVSLPARRHAIRIDKVIDDARVLHHVVLFRDTAKM